MNKELLKSITQDVAGIIWISAEPLSKDTLYFNELDYLLDGLISRKIIKDSEFTQSTSLLLSKSFGELFFIIHTCQSDVQLQSELDLIPKTNRSIIKVINTTDRQLSINHKTYRFEKL